MSRTFFALVVALLARVAVATPVEPEIPRLGGSVMEAIRDECLGRMPTADRPALPEALASLEIAGGAPDLSREGRLFVGTIARSIESREAAIVSCQAALERWRLADAYGDSDPTEAAYDARRCLVDLAGEEKAIESQARTCLHLRQETIRRLAGLESPVPFGLGARRNLNVSDLGALLGGCKDEEGGGVHCDLDPKALGERGWLGQGNLLGWATFVRREGELRLASLFVYRIADTCPDAAATAAQWWGRLERLTGPTPSVAHRLPHDRLCAQIQSTLQIGSDKFAVGTNEVRAFGKFVSYVEVTSDVWDRQPVRQKFEHYD